MKQFKAWHRRLIEDMDLRVQRFFNEPYLERDVVPKGTAGTEFYVPASRKEIIMNSVNLELILKLIGVVVIGFVVFWNFGTVMKAIFKSQEIVEKTTDVGIKGSIGLLKIVYPLIVVVALIWLAVDIGIVKTAMIAVLLAALKYIFDRK